MNKLVSKKGFWADLDYPVYCLAPMADVTDPVFRKLVAQTAKPSVVFTEFVSVDGLCSEGYARLVQDLDYDEVERPVVAQLFGDDPEIFKQAAGLMVELGFDGIDINMGCPVKVITKNGAGCSLIQNPTLAQEIVQATIEGAGELPVSVKTRIGYSRVDEIQDWTRTIVEANPVAITLHMRTKKEMSKVDAHWDVMPLAVEVVKGTGIKLIGNGDVQNMAHADELIEQYGIDGVMLGRAVFGNPWLFDHGRSFEEITIEERLATMIDHARLFEEMMPHRNFLIMRKFLRAYANGFDGAKELRTKLVLTNNSDDVRDVVEEWRLRYLSTESVDQAD